MRTSTATGRWTRTSSSRGFDRELTGEGWIAPKAVKHPDLGPVWIGGTGEEAHRPNAARPYMEEEALRNALFVLLLARASSRRWKSIG